VYWTRSAEWRNPSPDGVPIPRSRQKQRVEFHAACGVRSTTSFQGALVDGPPQVVYPSTEYGRRIGGPIAVYSHWCRYSICVAAMAAHACWPAATEPRDTVFRESPTVAGERQIS